MPKNIEIDPQILTAFEKALYVAALPVFHAYLKATGDPEKAEKLTAKIAAKYGAQWGVDPLDPATGYVKDNPVA